MVPTRTTEDEASAAELSAGQDPDILISVDHVRKKFCRNLRHSMWYGVKDLSRDLVGVRAPAEARLRKHEFWALSDVSFTLRRGDVLGLIGLNGSGKSTLLRLLTGIYPPDGGEISIRGRAAALIALGAGFHPDMTGRENIYLNGSILGISEREITAKLDAIVDFAEIGEFVDAPVSTYSSGMTVRLGFSMATALDPDILLIDEVLAVGDVRFRGKCYNLIKDLASRCTIILVSHQMPQVSMVCNKVCYLVGGKIAYFDTDVAAGIEMYLRQGTTDAAVIAGSGKVRMDDIRIAGVGEGEGDATVRFRDPLEVSAAVRVGAGVSRIDVGVTFLTLDQRMAAQVRSGWEDCWMTGAQGDLCVSVHLPRCELSPGSYYVSLLAFEADSGELVAHYYAIRTIHVRGDFSSSCPVSLAAEWRAVPIRGEGS